MKRKIIYAAAAWGAGLLLTSLLPSAYDFIIIPAAIILLSMMKFLFKFGIKEILTVIITFSIAVSIYRLYDIFEYRKILDYSGKEIAFSGKIIEMKEHSGDKTTYTVKGKINNEKNATITVYADSCNCSINDYLIFDGTVKQYENNYLFESRDYYKSKGIYLTADKISSLKINYNDNFSIMRIINKYTEKIKYFIKRNLPEEESSMLCGMLFGDKSGISSDDKTMFYRTGIGHVMAVSGLHLVLFCGIFSFILKKFRFGRIKSFIILEALMFLFALSGGLSQSVLRAALMMTLVYSAGLFFRKADTLNSIAIAFILLTLPCPYAIRNPSLILSIAGTFSAGVFAPYMTENLKDNNFINKCIKNTVYVLFISVGVFPFSVMFFGECSLFSPIANILLTPLCMLALVPTLIASIIIFLEPVFLVKISGILCSIIIKCVRFTGKLKFSGMNFDSNMKYAVAVILIVCITVYLIFKNKKYESAAIILSAVTVIIMSVINFCSFRNNLNIVFLGDKSNDVIVVSCGNKTEVIDISGNKNNARYTLKYLQENNIYEIDGIIIKSKPYQAMSLYTNEFSLIDTNSVYMPEDTIIREGVKICNCDISRTNYENLDIQLDDCLINIKNSRIYIRYGEFELVCDNELHDVSADIYAEYDNIFNPPECSAVIVPEYENKNKTENIITYSNVRINAEKDRSFSIGGL